MTDSNKENIHESLWKSPKGRERKFDLPSPQCVAGNGEEVQADLSQNEIGNVAITNAAVDTTDGTATNAGEGDASTTEPSLANEINVDVGDDDNKCPDALDTSDVLVSEEEEVASKNDSIREGVDSLSVGDMPILKEQTTGGDDETNNKSQNQGSPRRSSLPSNPYHPDNEVESNDVESMAANDNSRDYVSEEYYLPLALGNPMSPFNKGPTSEWYVQKDDVVPLPRRETIIEPKQFCAGKPISPFVRRPNSLFPDVPAPPIGTCSNYKADSTRAEDNQGDPQPLLDIPEGNEEDVEDDKKLAAKPSPCSINGATRPSSQSRDAPEGSEKAPVPSSFTNRGEWYDGPVGVASLPPPSYDTTGLDPSTLALGPPPLESHASFDEDGDKKPAAKPSPCSVGSEHNVASPMSWHATSPALHGRDEDENLASQGDELDVSNEPTNGTSDPDPRDEEEPTDGSQASFAAGNDGAELAELPVDDDDEEEDAGAAELIAVQPADQDEGGNDNVNVDMVPFDPPIPVMKEFDNGWFRGFCKYSVIGEDDETGERETLFYVEYEDSDEEDLSAEEFHHARRNFQERNIEN